jgi:hypothetical protein
VSWPACSKAGRCAADGSQGGRVAHPEQEPEDLLGRVLPQPHHRQQHLIGRGQAELAPGPDGPLTVRAVEGLAVGDLDRRHHVVHHGVERRDGQPGQVPEHARVCPKVVQSSDHGRGLPWQGDSIVRLRTDHYREEGLLESG